MKILVLASLTPATGNLLTASKIAGHLNSVGHEVVLKNVHEVKSAGELEESFDLAFGVHSFRAGRYLKGIAVPYCLVLPGPDLDLSNDEEKWPVVTEAISKAKHVITSHAVFKNKLLSYWPEFKDKILVFPKATTVEEPTDFELRSTLDLPSNSIVCLHPAGLRPVKDCTYLFDTFAKWHQENPQVHCVLVGQLLDEDYAKQVLAEVDKNLLYITYRLFHEQTFSKQSDKPNLVVNTAKSEGLPNALLEAMALGTPVIARDIPGNAALIESGRNGILYKNADEFLKAAKELVADSILCKKLTTAAQADVKANHGLEAEAKAYQSLLATLP